MVANGDGNKLIWSTEYGTPTSVVSESTQAAIIQDYLNSWSQFSYAGPSFIYTTRDINSSSTNPDDTFGVLRDDWSWKPAAYVIQQWTATHPQQSIPVDLMAAMQNLAPNALVAMDATSGALTTVDPATGQPVPVTALATAAAARTAAQPPASADPMTAVGQAMSAMATNASADLQSAMTGMAADVTQSLNTALQPATSPTAPQTTSATAAALAPAPASRSVALPRSSGGAADVPNPKPTIVAVGPSAPVAAPAASSAAVAALSASPAPVATTPVPSALPGPTQAPIRNAESPVVATPRTAVSTSPRPAALTTAGGTSAPSSAATPKGAGTGVGSSQPSKAPGSHGASATQSGGGSPTGQRSSASSPAT